VDLASRGGNAPDGRKVKSTMHWVSAAKSVPAEVRLYDRLFAVEDPGSQTGKFQDYLSPDSLKVLKGCRLEPAAAGLKAGDSIQLERLGYFAADRDSGPGSLVLNRTVSLRDSYSRASP
jgi:glutaminyl-tRNA synthetase